MKKYLSLFLLTALLTATQFVAAQSTVITDPVKYNDFIVDQQDKIGNELLKLIGMFDALPEDDALVYAQLDLVVAQCKKSIVAVQGLKPIQKEFGLKENALGLFRFYEDVMSKEYKEVIAEMYVEVPNLERMQEILASIQEREAVFDAAFQTSQSQFAEYHNFELTENELQQELDGEGE